MFRRRPVLWTVVGLAIIFAVLAGMLLTSRPPFATASDGRSARIEKVTYGTEHSFTARGPVWVRILRPVLGTRWAAVRGSYETRLTSTNPVMVVWTRWSGISGTNPLPLEASIVDAHGTESELVVRDWNQTDYWAHTNRFESTNFLAWMFPNYPRRSDPLRLRIYDRDARNERQRVLEMAFPNPGPRRYRQWPGEPPPITYTNAGVEFTLKSFTQATPSSWNAAFDVRTNGAVDSSWQVGRIYARDATGNFVSTMTNVIAGGHGPAPIALQGTLWPDERAWKISAEFCRAFDFASNECWTTPQIPIRPVTQAWGTNISLTNVAVNGSTVVLGELESNISVPLPRNLRGSVMLTAWLLNMSVPSRLFVVSAVDDRQREVQIQPGTRVWIQQTASDDGWHMFSLLPPPESKALQFTFAVRKATPVEFQVANPLTPRIVERQEHEKNRGDTKTRSGN
jgi:hypothetical protein